MVLEKTLESPLDCKEIKPENPKEISPESSLKGLMLKLKLRYFGHLMGRTDSLEKTLTLGKMVGWHHQPDVPESEQTPGVCDGQGGLVCWSPRGHKELDMTE